MCVVLMAVAGCKGPFHHNLPPAQQLMEPGPGVGGPGPGVQAMYMPPAPGPEAVSQILFAAPDDMVVMWDVTEPGAFDSGPHYTPFRQNFPQGAIYRLKLTEIPGMPGIELYPTLEVGPATPRTQAFLAHNAIPVSFTDEDFDQVFAGNFVTKVIYLPDPEYQDLAVAGPDTLVSTRLDPGVDPVIEADRRGSILAIVRLGNRDLELPGESADAQNVVPAQYAPGMPSGFGVAAPGVPMAGPSNYISGVTGPQYGMPISGTPIGLAGPPHVPLGAPAGLQKHVMRNHTHVHMPQPSSKVRIDVKQTPGISYPKPADHVWISEHTTSGLNMFHQPLSDRVQVLNETTEACPADAAPMQ